MFGNDVPDPGAGTVPGELRRLRPRPRWIAGILGGAIGLLLAGAGWGVVGLGKAELGSVPGGGAHGPSSGSRARTEDASRIVRNGRLVGYTATQLSEFVGQVSPSPQPGGRGTGTRTRPGGAANAFRQRGMGGDPRLGVPEWEINDSFREDVFAFARLQYRVNGRGGWRVDFPGADLNFSYRLHRLTSMKVNPEPTVVSLDDERVFQHPFLFMADPRSITLNREEADTLRRYLLGGGFILVDDFWGRQMWSHLMSEMAKVFPDRQPVSLPFEHSIFQVPYHLPYKPQVPSDDSAEATKDMPDPYRTWEYEITTEEPQPVDYRAFLDDKGRVMMLIGWNTDLSDGWEQEQISEWFFREYSEKLAYPMGINIMFYAMTH